MAARRAFSRIQTFLVVIATVGACFLFWREAIAPNLFAKRFGIVEPGKIYRSGKLTPAALGRLHDEYGIRTVLDLGAYPIGSADEEREQRAAETLGIKRVRYDLAGDSTGNPNVYVVALRMMTDPAQQPILVHCGAGTERTGCAVILYRHIIQGVPYSQAYDEAEAAGHDPGRNPVLFKTLLDWAGPIEAAYRSGGQVAGAPPTPQPIASAQEPAGSPR